MTGGKVAGDASCLRIQELVAEHLIQVARSPDGWSCLYRDPSDGRLWEHTYPQSELHGGGPPALALVTQEQAFARYGIGA
ncbi:hypothetical protein B5P43_00005 [Bacillus sp. SRB_336]|nr:hypothetical protein B5P43_00005 [Bacillus sp. SRB_336]